MEPIYGSQGQLGILISKILGKQLIPYSYDLLTASGTAQNLPNIPANAVGALLTVEVTTGIRYRTDGGNPTATVGHLLANLQILQISGLESLQKFKAIESTAGTNTIKITYYV